MYIIDVAFTRQPKRLFDAYESEFYHRNYRIRRFKLTNDFNELLSFMGIVNYHKATIIRITEKQPSSFGGKVVKTIVDEFPKEF